MENLAPYEFQVKMGIPNPLLKFYYFVRPSIPRRLQILVRRRLSETLKNRSKCCWPISYSAAAVPEFWSGWKDDKKFALVLTHDVEKRGGYRKHRKLMEIEQKMGFVSSYNFVPERYLIDETDLKNLNNEGFEVGVHGLCHDGKLLKSKIIFLQRAQRINEYIRKWGACGFRAPSMHHNLDWFKHLDIEYDLSTFDTDPFEPQADGVNTIFPFYVSSNQEGTGYWELPYTLPQDSTLFVILEEKSADIWKQKADWIAENGGMILLNTHPDYMNFGNSSVNYEEYPVEYYIDFLMYIQERYSGDYWNPLPREMAGYLNEVRSIND